MAQLIGGKGQTPTPQQPKIDLSQAEEITCQECGGSVFIPGNKFLKISKIITGTPQDAIIPVELYLCGDCGEINQELLPKELQTKK